MAGLLVAVLGGEVVSLEVRGGREEPFSLCQAGESNLEPPLVLRGRTPRWCRELPLVELCRPAAGWSVGPEGDAPGDVPALAGRLAAQEVWGQSGA